MRWFENMNDTIKRGIRNWLNIVPATPYSIQINEMLDFETNAIRNRIWYRGDSNEIEQLYMQTKEYADKYKFWASRCTSGMEIRKIHTGLPCLIVKILAAIVLSDMNEFEFESEQQRMLWEEIERENKFLKKMETVLKDVLVVGDGAFKVTIDTQISQFPILQWYSGEYIEIVYRHDRLYEVLFKTPYKHKGKTYVLNERYGYGYIRNELYLDEKLVEQEAAGLSLSDYKFDASVMLAVPLQVYESAKYKGRGGSVYDGKMDSFDAFDETWSQWMDALRAGRAKTYIPEALIPKDPYTGQIMIPNAFDNRYIKTDNNMAENANNQIDTEQPSIPHDSYAASYSTALDLCLQGIISPSTLGIDVKKLDNADAQREKEKATLYTRNAIIEALQETLPEVVAVCINAYHILLKQAVEEVKVSIPFGEYANPSFESQVETVAKGKQGGILSIEAAVEELYGDSKDEQWKKEEIARLKAEQGIAEMDEPALNTEGISHMEVQNEGQGSKQNIQNEQE